MTFPSVRMQRYRQTPSHRKLMAETTLSKSHFICPLFINQNIRERKEIKKMPGIYQQSLETLLPEVERLVNLGLQSVLLFGIPNHKDEAGSSAYDPQGVVQQAIKMIKTEFPGMVVIADCCLCEYTSHGHCGIHDRHRLDNDQTLDVLQKVALSYAESGVDIIAPSGMMDGVIAALREALDSRSYGMIPLMSYAVKFASQFYGPFREAAGSEDNFKGDRKHHQLAPSQQREALREAFLDLDEGADFLMVKPALPYLDIIKTLREQTLLPIVAYQVSGEYAMLKSAARQGLLADEKEAFHETLIAIKRAGADLIISYYADEIAKHLP